MPSCYIKNCTSRTGRKNIKFFQFPKDATVLQQWLKACRKNEGEIKTNSATVCSLHFNDDCFEMVWTKPRQKNIFARQILRLRKNSVPTRLLNMEKKRKSTLQNGNKRIKTSIHTGIPTYAELVQHVRKKQHIYPDQTTFINTITSENKRLDSAVQKPIEEIDREYNISAQMSQSTLSELQHVREKQHICPGQTILINTITSEDKRLDSAVQGPDEEIDRENNISAQSTLLKLLKKSEEEKNKLLKENMKLMKKNAELIKINDNLTSQLELLEKNIQQKLQEVQKKATHALHKFFTPGQIKILMSPNNNTRIKWSSEDITSAIALRSLSPKVYRFLRNVKKMPLPSMSTLNNWCEKFNVQPDIFKNVLKIIENKGHDLSKMEKLTVT